MLIDIQAPQNDENISIRKLACEILQCSVDNVTNVSQFSSYWREVLQ
jgi:hypothetical protein